MSRTLICLGGGIESVPIIRRVKELGFHAVVVDGNPDAPGFSLAQRTIVASCYHADECLPTLRTTGMHYDGVLCAGVDAPHVAAAIAADFGLPGPSLEAAQRSCDKVLQTDRLGDSGIPVPDSVMNYYGTVDLPGFGIVPLDLNPHALAEIGNVVIKPADSRGGRGVVRLQAPADDMGPVFEACAYARQYSRGGKLLGQAWLDGPQLSTESIVQNGAVLFTAVGLRNYSRLDEFYPHVIEDGFYEPGDRVTHPDVDELIAKACRALGWYQTGGGTVKGDLVIHNGKLYVIELAARLSGGFFASHGHPLAYGVDFVGLAAQLALGYEIQAPHPYPRGFVCQRYIFPQPSDIGRRVVSLAQPVPGAEWATWNIHPGDVIRPVTAHPDRWGQALCTGRTADEAWGRAEQAAADMQRSVVLE